MLMNHHPTQHQLPVEAEVYEKMLKLYLIPIKLYCFPRNKVAEQLGFRRGRKKLKPDPVPTIFAHMTS